METYESWLNNTLESFAAYKQTLSNKDIKKYKLDYIARVAKRIADLSNECEEEKKNYDRKIKEITSHLQKKHKLVAEGTYVGFGIAVGPAIGVALGSGMGNVGAGIGIGIGIGLAIGSALEAKAKKDGKII
jgi:hypothetical protein